MSYSPDKAPKNETVEVSNPEWEVLKEDAEKYLALIREHIAETSVRSRSMNHILRNLDVIIEGCTFGLKEGEMPDQFHCQGLKKAVIAVKKYFMLLEEFPNFAEGEINSEEGYFSKNTHNYKAAIGLIDDYERALKEEVK